jgi:hypothetical protein
VITTGCERPSHSIRQQSTAVDRSRQDIDLTGDPPLTIQKSKTAAGERVIPLTSEAFEAFIELRVRAEMFGPAHPEHYVFARSVARFEGNVIAEAECFPLT